jgi:hypothetical protein
MSEVETKTIDSKVEAMLDWASTRKVEAEQLAMDSARLIACTGERMDTLAKQGFFKRCWSRFNGDASAMERANTNDLIQMQKMGFRYINMLQEQQLMMAHSMLSLKNNLLSLTVKEEETRNLITLLAQRTLDRFEELENRVDQIEISTNLQGWLLGLEEREYDERIPTENMRLFQVINDFYTIKNDAWNYNDLMFMRKAIRTVGLDPKNRLSINIFIDSLTDEILEESVGFEKYKNVITRFNPDNIDNFSTFAIENISSPVFTTLHGLKIQYTDRLDVVETLQDNMNISTSDALKLLLRKSIANLNVNLDYKFPLAETAIEILGCIRLTDNLLRYKNGTNDLIEIDNTINNIDEPEVNRDLKEQDNSKKDSINNDNEQKEDDCDIQSKFTLSFFSKIMEHDSSYFIRNSSMDYFPMKKIYNATMKYGFADVNDVVVFYDDTLFGSGTDGFYATQDEFYYNVSLGESGSFRFSEIRSVKQEKDDVIVITKNDNIHKFHFASFENSSLVTALYFIKIMYDEEKT